MAGRSLVHITSTANYFRNVATTMAKQAGGSRQKVVGMVQRFGGQFTNKTFGTFTGDAPRRGYMVL